MLSAEGRDTRGAGNARATITATLTPDGDGTQVSVVTDLDVTGRVAQFGRGVLADVSAKLMEQFADCLSGQLASGSTTESERGRESAAQPGTFPPAEANGSQFHPAEAETAADAGTSHRTGATDPAAEAIGAATAAVDLGRLAAGAIIKRLLPLAGAGVVGFWLLWRNRRRRARG